MPLLVTTFDIHSKIWDSLDADDAGFLKLYCISLMELQSKSNSLIFSLIEHATMHLSFKQSPKIEIETIDTFFQ